MAGMPKIHELNFAITNQDFTLEKRQTLQMGKQVMTAWVKALLAEKYPGREMSRVADSLMHRFTQTVSQQHTQSLGQNHSHGIQV